MVVEDEEDDAVSEELNEDEVINEIARISTGEITEISLNHAKELRKSRVA